MIKMRYEQLSQTNFQKTWAKLMQKPMKTAQAFRLKYITDDLNKEQEKMRESFKEEIFNRYSATDQNTPTQEQVQHNLPFAPKEGMGKEAEEAIIAFGKREFTLKHTPITAQTLDQLGDWAPSEIAALEPVLSPLIIVEEETEPQATT